MQCISPVTVRTFNGFQHVPCGKCNFCLQSRRADWSFRIAQEDKVSSSSYFITLTYEDSFEPLRPDWAVRLHYGLFSLKKRDVSLFMKRLRKEFGAGLRYFLVGEYGELFERPHYHLILFNLPLRILYVKDLLKLQAIWSHGFIRVGTVEPASIHYVTKYILNRTKVYTGRAPPFVFMSKRPGIGANYLVSHGDWHRNGKKFYTNINGFKTRLPRYYKERLFSSIERQAYAIKAVGESVAQYEEAVEALKKFHPDPEAYYYERIVYLHETLSTKMLKHG